MQQEEPLQPRKQIADVNQSKLYSSKLIPKNWAGKDKIASEVCMDFRLTVTV